MGSNKFTYVGGYFKLHELATSWIYRNYLLSYTESGTNILNIFSLNILSPPHFVSFSGPQNRETK